ncbi:hypothetical protein D3C71_1214880 [compost metagenome]
MKLRRTFEGFSAGHDEPKFVSRNRRHREPDGLDINGLDLARGLRCRRDGTQRNHKGGNKLLHALRFCSIR